MMTDLEWHSWCLAVLGGGTLIRVTAALPDARLVFDVVVRQGGPATATLTLGGVNRVMVTDIAGEDRDVAWLQNEAPRYRGGPEEPVDLGDVDTLRRGPDWVLVEGDFGTIRFEGTNLVAAGTLPTTSTKP